MIITITGCKNTPKWETLQQAVREALGSDDDNGRFTRIARVDNGVNYRDPGKYELTFTPRSGDDINIELNVVGVTPISNSNPPSCKFCGWNDESVDGKCYNCGR